jgi:hypothetical protein
MHLVDLLIATFFFIYLSISLQGRLAESTAG